MGPSVVVLTTPGHWVIGALINNVWSVAGSGSRPPVNQMLLQWSVNYNLKKGWYVVTSPIVTADWRASSGNQWVVPLGGEWAASCASDRSRSISQLSFMATQYTRPVVPPGACGCKFSSFIRRSRSHEEYQSQKTMGKT